MSNKNGTQRSIVDKVIFILLAVAAVIVFIYDIAKDFIPDEYWQAKLLVIIIGALSGFFTVLSFLWDKKFSAVSEEISASHDEKFDTITDKLQTFVQENFHSYDSFNDAIMPILKSKAEFNKVRIFAYSAKNYVECLMRSDVKINQLYLCLKRANDYSAWLVNDESMAQKYKAELKLVMENLVNLKERNIVADYQVRFYDFESCSHFGIFDDQILFGDLIPMFSQKKTMKIGKIQTLSNVGRNADFWQNKSDFFDKLFESSVADSGLELLQTGCHFCDAALMIQDPHHISASAFGKCDVSLIEDVNKIKDFLLQPDFYPISEMHMLLVCKFHILNLYDYFRRKNSIQDFEKTVYQIRDIVYKQTGKEILLFEHGTATFDSKLSGSSIEHLHVHVIYKPKTYDYIHAITTNISNGSKYVSLDDFSSDSSLRNKDYFMVWELGASKDDGQIYAWLPAKKESQFLRRIFFQGLSEEEKVALYGSSDGVFDDEYNWKIHGFEYSDERLEFHKNIGKEMNNV